MGISSYLPGRAGDDTDSNELQLLATLTRIRNLAVHSQQIDGGSRRELLDAIQQAKRVLGSADAQSSDYTRWAHMLEREVAGIKKSGLTANLARRLCELLSRVR